MLTEDHPAVVAAKKAIDENKRRQQELLVIAKKTPTLANLRALFAEQDKYEQLITDYCNILYGLK